MRSMQPITIGFIGGGTMAGAIIGGLRAAGVAASCLRVVEPFEAQRQRLREQFGVDAIAEPDASLGAVDVVVWAVKPQQFAQAASALRERSPRAADVLQLSIMAGVRCASIAARSGAGRVVRTMPNTPALIGKGIAGMVALSGVSQAQRDAADAIMRAVGATVWLDDESLIDPVTAVSGSGPAYVFYFIEAMQQAAQDMGLTAEQGTQLAIATFVGASQLAAQSTDPVSVLRERVTSKGGTTYAALTSMDASDVKGAIVKALKAAAARGKELGEEFGRD